MLQLAITALIAYLALKFLWIKTPRNAFERGRKWAAWPAFIAIFTSSKYLFSGDHVEGIAATMLLLFLLPLPAFILGYFYSVIIK